MPMGVYKTECPGLNPTVWSSRHSFPLEPQFNPWGHDGSQVWSDQSCAGVVFFLISRMFVFILKNNIMISQMTLHKGKEMIQKGIAKANLTCGPNTDNYLWEYDPPWAGHL